jgi:hypothetical protein
VPSVYLVAVSVVVRCGDPAFLVSCSLDADRRRDPTGFRSGLE